MVRAVDSEFDFKIIEKNLEGKIDEEIYMQNHYIFYNIETEDLNLLYSDYRKLKKEYLSNFKHVEKPKILVKDDFNNHMVKNKVKYLTTVTAQINLMLNIEENQKRTEIRRSYVKDFFDFIPEYVMWDRVEVDIIQKTRNELTEMYQEIKEKEE